MDRLPCHEKESDQPKWCPECNKNSWIIPELKQDNKMLREAVRDAITLLERGEVYPALSSLKQALSDSSGGES